MNVENSCFSPRGIPITQVSIQVTVVIPPWSSLGNKGEKMLEPLIYNVDLEMLTHSSLKKDPPNKILLTPLETGLQVVIIKPERDFESKAIGKIIPTTHKELRQKKQSC
jgi:hypothetical protein